MRSSSALLVVFLVAIGCGGSSAAKQGGERQDCYPNGTCNLGLTCLSNTCVNVNPDGGGGGVAGTTGAGGGAGSTAVAGTTGAAGSNAGTAGGGAGTSGGSAGGTGGSAGTGGGAGAGGGGGDSANCFAAANLGNLGSVTSPNAELSNMGDLLTWYRPIESGVPNDQVSLQLFTDLGVFGAGSFRTGTFTLTGDELNYATCGLCVLLYENVDAADNYRGVYMATGGTVTLTSVSGTLAGTMSNVTLRHVTIESFTFVSASHPDGCTSAIDSLTFNVDITTVAAAAPDR